MDASLRFWWDGGGYRRRQVHEQGLAACGVLGRRGDGGDVGRFPKKGYPRDWSLGRVRAEPAGLPAGWLRKRGGRGKSGQFSPRAKRPPSPRAPGASASPRRMRSNKQSGFSPSSRRACQPFLKGKSPHKQHFSANQPKPGAPHSSAFAPPGQTASPPHPAAPLAPLGQGSVAPRAQFQPIIIPPPPPQAQDQRCHSPPPPRPQKPPQAAGPCSWACRRLLPPPPRKKRKEAPMPPARGA